MKKKKVKIDEEMKFEKKVVQTIKLQTNSLKIKFVLILRLLVLTS